MSAVTPRRPFHERVLSLPLRRLDVRIVLLFLVLLIAVQAASFFTIRGVLDRAAGRRVADELDQGEKVLARLLVQNAASLRAAAEVLAADFGFRAAIASNDRETILDALANQSGRIGAAVAMYSDLQFEPVASTLTGAGEVMAQARAVMADDATAADDRAGVSLVGGRPYQLITVPVRAPSTIGYVTMGFPLTERLVEDLGRLTPLKLALFVQRNGAGWQALDIGAHAAAAQPLGPALGVGEQRVDLRLAGSEHVAQLVPLADGGGQRLAALMLRPLDDVVAEFHRLLERLLAISAAGIVAFAVGSLVTARRITGPIKRLSESARRLGAGDYGTPVVVHTHDEVSVLAESFEAMRTAIHEREDRIGRLAYWDELTGLPNRAQMLDRLTAALASSMESGMPCAVLMLDLDRFKLVNDALGHAFGDRMLQEVAKRLTDGVLRPDDFAARLSSDEFAVLLPASDAEAARSVAVRVRKHLQQPLAIGDQTIDVSVGIGLAVHPVDAQTAVQLLGRAEVAMYAAKAQFIGLKAYTPDLETAQLATLSMLTELQAAIENDDLRLYLQPKVALSDGRVVGVEALVRWQHPQRGLVPPALFIPFAEQTGFIRMITAWMIERCIACCQALQDIGAEVKFAINLSTRDLLDHDLPLKVERLLLAQGLSPDWICMEITESAVMDDPERALTTIHRLRAMGMSLSIDDFGTGYSSLAYLKRLPLHQLKIDKSFVLRMEQDRADEKIVRSVIDLAHHLDLEVVAEGVESEQVWAMLKHWGCDHAQGYFVAKPMPAEDFPDWLARWSAPEVRLHTEFSDTV
jgi:diguanylate cyclase (GGDEF)-like protein